MPDTTTARPNPWLRRLPLIAIAVVALIGAFALRDTLTFETLARNRERLLAFRDANYLLAVVAFTGVYTAIVAFSLPGRFWRR